MPFSLRRTRDGAGDSGPVSMVNRINPETSEIEHEHGQKPRVGWAVQVGALGGRTYSVQDFWQTTPVTEILEERDDFVRFRTGNSEYEWSHF